MAGSAPSTRIHSRTTKYGGARVGSRAAVFGDSPYISRRLLQPNTIYAGLDEDSIAKMLKATKNAHEFLALFRLLRGHTQFAAGKAVGVARHTYEGWEKGIELPGTDSLSGLKDYVGEDLHPRFEALLIANRLAMVWGALKNKTDGFGRKSEDHYKKAAHILLGRMPQAYWNAVISYHMTDRNTITNSLEALWKPHLIPIKTKAAYLFASRHYLSMGKKEVGQQTGINPRTVMSLENGANNPDAEEGKKLAMFYEQKSQCIVGYNDAASQPLFNRQRYDALPSGYRREEVNRHQAAAYRRRIAHSDQQISPRA